MKNHVFIGFQTAESLPEVVFKEVIGAVLDQLEKQGIETTGFRVSQGEPS